VSGTVYIGFRDRGVWATSTGLAVLLGAMVGCVEKRSDAGWLEPVGASWRVQACIRDLGMTLEPDWTFGEVQGVVDVIDEAVSWLMAKGTLEPDELNNWIVLDGMHVDNGRTFTQPLPVGGVVDIAQAVKGLLTGTLPEDPEGGWWFVGTDAGPTVMPRRN
jgi:hypothetical protein